MDKFAEGGGLEEKTRENALFLSVVAQFNGEISLSISRWFQGLVTLQGLKDHYYESYTTELLRNQEKRTRLINCGGPRKADQRVSKI
jgi:hypothetical protein